MRLIKLEANFESFHTVKFNPKGLTFITGKVSDPSSRDKTKTYNGVGKSLLIKLIHFCLGSNKIKAFGQKLPDWEFTLTFEGKSQNFVVTRSTNKQDVVIVNGSEKSLNEYKTILAEESFENLPKKEVTFRSLINRFIRPDKASYSFADVFQSEETDFTLLANNSFLLGLDTDRVLEKRRIRKEKLETIAKRDSFKKDDILKEFFSGKKDPDIELIDIEDQIAKLENSIQGFDVAEDFHEIRVQADAASKTLRELENQIFLIQNSMSNIEKSLQVRSDLSEDKVIKVYEEAKLKFPHEVRVEVADVINFHKDLIQKRTARLIDEKNRLNKKFKKLEEERKETGKILDQSMKYLNSHRALDEFVALNSKLSDLLQRSQRIRDYKTMISQYEAKIQSYSIDLNKSNIATEEYLTDITPTQIHKINTLFRSLAKEFYSDRPGGVSIKNNSGDNQVRYDINIKIQDDASDGINEVKIFCFDMCLLMMQNNHNVKFVFHDSRLFSDIDVRQRATIFKVASDVCNKNNLQYIASINQDQLEGLKQELGEKEYQSLIDDCITLELTDESSASKLLGIQVDLDYDE